MIVMQKKSALCCRCFMRYHHEKEWIVEILRFKGKTFLDSSTANVAAALPYFSRSVPKRQPRTMHRIHTER